MTFGYPTNDMVFRLKGQRSQGHKVQKHIEGDRVAGTSIECLSSSYLSIAFNVRFEFHSHVCHATNYMQE